MEIFVDSTNLDESRRWLEYGVADGLRPPLNGPELMVPATLDDNAWVGREGEADACWRATRWRF